MSFKSLIKWAETESTYLVTRKGSPVYIDGRLQPSSTSSFNIIASVQPLTGKDMSILPEGSRADNTKSLYTMDKLNTVGTAEPDVVTIDSVEYEVINVEHWKAFGDAFYRTLVKKVE